MREDAHAGVDVSIANAREIFEREAQNARLAWGPDPRSRREMVERAAAWAASRPEFAAALHAAVDAEPSPIGQPAFSKLRRAEFEKEQDRFRREIAARAIELERREVTRRKAEADGELAAVEE